MLEEGGSLVLAEGKDSSLKIKPDPGHLEYLKSYVNKQVHFGIRPEDLNYVESAGNNSFGTKVTVVEPLGAETHLWLSTGTQPLVARTDPQGIFKVGDTANFIPRMEKARYFDKETELALVPAPIL